MFNGEDHLNNLRQRLGMARMDELGRIQAVLDDWYPHQVRAKRLHEGVLQLVTESAAIAGELRLRQVELRQKLRLDDSVERIQITIGAV